MQLLRGCHTIHTRRDTIIPLVRGYGSSPRTNDLPRPPAMVTTNKVPWLSSLRSDRRVSQCRGQPTPTQSTVYSVYNMYHYAAKYKEGFDYSFMYKRS